MPRFCANISLLFGDKPLPVRIAAAAAAEFDAVEILSPYDSPAQDIRNALALNEMPLALINCPPPNYAGGAPGYAAVPETQTRFRSDFRRSMRYVQTLNPKFMHVLAGETDDPKARDCFVENLRWAAAEAPEQQLTIEPINPTDRPGYFLDSFDLALELLEEVSAPNLHLQFDAYHAHMITGDVFGTWEKCKTQVAHVQFAGFPGRLEPQIGDFDFAAFFAQLDSDGYDGWVSAEYFPKGRTEEGLGWMRSIA